MVSITSLSMTVQSTLTNIVNLKKLTELTKYNFKLIKCNKRRHYVTIT